MHDRAKLIKEALTSELEKQGSSLQELESILSNPEAMEKMALPNIMVGIEKFPDMLLHLLQSAGFGAAGIGAAGGLAGYMAYKGNADSTDQQLKKLREKQQYIDATQALKDNLHSPITI
jgi:hypothetical protein